MGHSALPPTVAGAMSLRAAATQSKPTPPFFEEFDDEEEGAGAGAADAGSDDDGEGAGAGLEAEAEALVLGAAKGLTVGFLTGVVVAATASAGAANPSATVASESNGVIPEPRRAPLAAAASSRAAGK